MPRSRRSLGFIAVALLAGAATTAVCLCEAMGLLDGHSAAIAASGADDPIAIVSRGRTWLNGQPSPQSLRGKVILVNFWTYSCINSLRALPYLRAWEAKYRDQGLVMIGIHTPEFGFERDPAKVQQALTRLGVDYPVLLDSDYGIWRQFDNQGWPGFYFIGADGRVRDYRVGEGDYAASERLIRTLLAETRPGSPEGPPTPVRGEGIEAEADWADLASPETYIGFDKATHFQSPGGMRERSAHAYQAAASLPLNHWDLTGRWTVGSEFATLDNEPGQVRMRFHARDLHLVLGAPEGGRPARFRVLIDGASPGADHGADVDAEGWGEIREDRLYQLVRQSGAVRDRIVTIEFLQPGVRAYVFTFG